MQDAGRAEVEGCRVEAAGLAGACSLFLSLGTFGAAIPTAGFILTIALHAAIDVLLAVASLISVTIITIAAINAIRRTKAAPGSNPHA